MSDGSGHVSNKATFGVTVAAAAPTGTIAGTVISDANANGKLDVGEKGLPGVTVYIDANKNGSLDPTEVHVTTDAAATSSSRILPPGRIASAKCCRRTMY